MSTLAQLDERRRRAQEAFSKADAALLKGAITQRERDALLTHLFASADERHVLEEIAREEARIAPQDRAGPAHKAASLVVGFSIIMVSLFAVLFYSTGGATGAVVLEVRDVGQNYTGNATLALALNSTTRVNVTGMASGEGDIALTLVHGGERTLIYRYLHAPSATAHARLPKAAFPQGEDVTYEASDVSSAYLMDGAQALPLDGTQRIAGLAPGEYDLVLLVNSSDAGLAQERLPFSVVPAGTPAPAEAFNACGDACRVNITGDATLEIAVTDGASLRLERVLLGSQENRPPALAAQVPDLVGARAVRIALAPLFADPDGDTLSFTSSDYPGNNETIENGTLTVEGAPGTYGYVIYATDGAQLASTNMFSVTLTGDAAPAPGQNETSAAPGGTNASQGTPQQGNATAPGASTDANATAAPQDNATQPGQRGDCSDPDPNRRPLECIQENGSTYFRPEDIDIENKAAVLVGRLTPIGNLLIRGDVVEHSTAAPDPSDYQMGYTDDGGDFVPTLWIDTASGDLHLRGSLTEANGNVPLGEGLSAIANGRGIVLALIDRHAGDLTLRGNVIPYRRSLG